MLPCTKKNCSSLRSRSDHGQNKGAVSAEATR
jgi:hypothetical protein